ncbi:MAG: LPS export ABC transporter periplasmic protein LptC [Candidatus Paracaedibacteraceae bacterium]|nr:LPS export ABC transporter periplasmic protein LptC [Candidatus Paracaedibacteraceae bacterium]
MMKFTRPKRNKKLKRILPAITVLLILAIAFWPNIYKWLSPPPPPHKVVSTIAKNSLEKPKDSIANEARDIYFDGVDKNNQPYTLIAKQGTEFKKGTVELTLPTLTLKLNSGQIVMLKSDKAILYKEQQKIELINHVVLTHTTGYEFTTEKAWLDMETSAAFGHDPITGTGPQGQLSAKRGFKLTDKGERVSFIGRPELLIQKEGK